MATSRRSFLGWLGALASAPLIGRAAAAESMAREAAQAARRAQPFECDLCHELDALLYETHPRLVVRTGLVRFRKGSWRSLYPGKPGAINRVAGVRPMPTLSELKRRLGG